MANESFDPTFGPARSSLERREREHVAELERQGNLVLDGRRARSHYFDGRFLAARDLTREQNYALSRQADLARAGGAAVIRGLDVSLLGERGLQIAAGHGITFTGELAALDADVSVALDAVPELQRLDASFGLAQLPPPTSELRSGLYVLALRPIEFATRDIVKYPTTLDGRRSLEAGDIVEGVAITLIPYSEDRAELDAFKQRAHLARTIFLEQSARGLPAETLPLAMLRLERGLVRWLDPFLVRRETGAEHANVLGFGLTPRALREAHLAQYDAQLRDIVGARQARGAPGFAASEYFEILPPAGRMPAAAIDSADFTQRWFPPQMSVDLSIVAEDEVTALVEESMFMPPIDLTGDADDLDFTTMQVLIPLDRGKLRRLRVETTQLASVALPALRARLPPRALLQRLSRAPQVLASDPRLGREAAWREALAAVADQLLWFVRRRTTELRSTELFFAPRQGGS